MKYKDFEGTIQALVDRKLDEIEEDVYKRQVYHICLFQGGFLLSFLKTLEKGGRRVSAPVPGRHCSQCGA